MMTEKPYNVLFLCTGNSARSILAESVLNRLGNRRFRAFSAGSFPKGEVHPFALDLLKRRNYPTEQLRSKSWTDLPAAEPSRSISSSRFATTPPAKCVQFGLGSL